VIVTCSQQTCLLVGVGSVQRDVTSAVSLDSAARSATS